MTLDFKEEFWARVDIRGPNECWPWKLKPTSWGYGCFTFKCRKYRSHRVAFFLTLGYWPKPFCLHKCDNRVCCNQNCLFEGTPADNTDDMIRKGRGNAGKHYNTSLSQRDIEQIIMLCNEGALQREVAKKFGISQPTVSGIVNRKHWVVTETIPA